MSNKFMNHVFSLTMTGMDENKGGPFGAIIVKNNKIIAEGINCVTSLNDPTAHAEIVAIRNACKALNHFQLNGCEIYTNCEPCLMCFGAIYWARIDRVYFAANRLDAQRAGFDDLFIYEEVLKDLPHRKIPMQECERNAALEIFEKWRSKPDKTFY